MCHEAGCLVAELEKGTPASNRAERAIKTLKDGVRADLFATDSPLCLWCYCLERRARIICSTVRTNFMLKGQTPHTMLTGKPTDISALSDFGWYDWVIYRHDGQNFPLQSMKLGRVLGPARNAGNELSHWVLTIHGRVLPIQTIRLLTESERTNPSMITRMNEYDKAIRARLGDCSSPPPEPSEVELSTPEDLDKIHTLYQPYEGWYGDDKVESYDLADVDDYEDSHGYESLLQAEVMLPRNGESIEVAKVIRRAKDDKGNTIGTYHPNPILDTQLYKVMFSDGSIEKYAANTIAQNIYSQVDEHGRRYQLFEAILDHRKDYLLCRLELAGQSRRMGKGVGK